MSEGDKKKLQERKVRENNKNRKHEKYFNSNYIKCKTI